MQTHNTLKQLNYVKTNYSTRIHSGTGIDVPHLRLQHQKKRQDRKKNRKAQLGQIHIPCTQVQTHIVKGLRHTQEYGRDGRWRKGLRRL